MADRVSTNALRRMGASATKAAWDSAHQLKRENKALSKLLAWYGCFQTAVLAGEYFRCRQTLVISEDTFVPTLPLQQTQDFLAGAKVIAVNAEYP